MYYRNLSYIMTFKDPEAKRAYARKYYKEHQKHIDATFKKWRQGPGKTTFTASVIKCQTRKRTRVKKEIFEHYGGTPPKCACCGETITGFLTLDHINGGGTKHKPNVMKIKGGGNDSLKYYNWIIDNKFPAIYQILCMNCNWGRRLDGICPHKKEHPPL